MTPTDNNQRPLVGKELTDALIRVGLIGMVTWMCLKIFAPFLSIMTWALILAVAIYPMHLMLVKKLKGKHGRSATVIVLLGLLIIGGPTVMLGDSFAKHLHGVYEKFNAGTLTITPPNEDVKDWPVIGNKIYPIWQSASSDLTEFVKTAEPQLKEASKKIFGIAADTAGSILQFLGSLIIAGIMMAYGPSGSQAMLNIFNRLSNGEKGARLQKLSVGTIRSVATGVLGVAFIQALLLGIGFIVADIPAAGVLAVLVMVLGILQLPAMVISLPAIAYLWTNGEASVTMNTIFTVYILIAGLADNVLKPILLGRGVDAPMPVILLGALGGMVVAGIIGLFTGAVILAIGYQIFMEWVEEPLNTPK